MSRLLLVLLIAACGAAQQTPQSHPATQPATTQASRFAQLMSQLGDPDYLVREEATRALIAVGEDATEDLLQRLPNETDPEIRRRLSYILENIAPPRQAVLIVRADPASGLRPGDLITHVDGNRMRYVAGLERRLNENTQLASIRVRGESGARDLQNVPTQAIITVAEYVYPRSEAVRRAVRLYVAGRAEEAYEQIKSPAEPLTPAELSPELQAILAHTAGDGAIARQLLSTRASSLISLRTRELNWTGDSGLDESGPGRAPYHLEMYLWELGVPGESNFDPDMPIQRVLIPANRRADALIRAARIWRRCISGDAPGPDPKRIAGNALAITSWMLHDIGLESECARLIEPRSQLLREVRAGMNVQRWVRKQTDAWLPFFAGQPLEALESFYPHAERILKDPPEPGRAIIQNPQIAAMVAFFAYQVPGDKRTADLLAHVNRADHPALAAYAYWMLFSLAEFNNELICRHLAELMATFSALDRPVYARYCGILEYAQAAPDPAVLATAREWLATSTDATVREKGPALIDTLVALANRRTEDAVRSAAALGDQPGAGVLRHTAAFLADPPPGADEIPELAAPLMAIPVGTTRDVWLVLARDRTLHLFDAPRRTLTPVQKPSPNWFPGPLNWPWLGREEASGRVWIYGARRIYELRTDEQPPLRLNLRTDHIGTFDRLLSPLFSVLAESVQALPVEENSGEFLTADLKAGVEYTADPAFHEIGVLQSVPGEQRLTHVCIRGGEHFLIENATGKHWSSRWMAQQLGLATPPTFFPQGSSAGADQPARLYLFADQGLIRFDPATEKIQRLTLPGDAPHPHVIPEWTPYVRTDPRWIYGARLPGDGGKVFRVRVADDAIEPLEMVNEALPADFDNARSRAQLRREISERLLLESSQTLEEFISAATLEADRMTTPGAGG